MKLKDKVAIITGASSGFGKASALLFAKEGAKLILVARKESSLKETENEIKKLGAEVISIPADVSSEENIKKIIETSVEKFKKIDIIFNNAGTFGPGNVEETDLETWNKVMNINLTSIFLMAKYAMEYLKESKGSIINTASAGGLIGFPQAASYAASKGAVISLTRSIAVDYAKDGVRCNAICPGTSATNMTEEVLKVPELCEGFLAPIPLHRFGNPEDVAHAALYLASDDSSYVTGISLPVDGGWTMA